MGEVMEFGAEVDEEVAKNMDSHFRLHMLHHLHYLPPSQDFLSILMIQWLPSWPCKLWVYHHFLVCQHFLQRLLQMANLTTGARIRKHSQDQEGGNGVGITIRKVIAPGETPVPTSTELIV